MSIAIRILRKFLSTVPLLESFTVSTISFLIRVLFPSVNNNNFDFNTIDKFFDLNRECVDQSSTDSPIINLLDPISNLTLPRVNHRQFKYNTNDLSSFSTPDIIIPIHSTKLLHIVQLCFKFKATPSLPNLYSINQSIDSWYQHRKFGYSPEYLLSLTISQRIINIILSISL